MSARLDLVLKRYPNHEEGIRALASRDPSGNLKYLDWSAKALDSGQALASEIADVVDLFHRFNGQRYGKRRQNRVSTDIHSYRPQDLASLRDNLLKIKRATNTKRRKRERLYRIEGAVEADVIFDSPDLIVRHIKNKPASVHYGLNTKWCISMNQEGYFEDYETNNATFFFFERKTPQCDEFDKVAVMMPRSDGDYERTEAFTTLDQRVDMMSLAKVFGSRVFEIFRRIYECSNRHPASVMSQVRTGVASAEQLEAVFARIVKRELSQHETKVTLCEICCNDNASWPLLEEIGRRAVHFFRVAKKPKWARSNSRTAQHEASLTRSVMAATVIHSNTPESIREKLTKELRRRHVNIDSIRRTNIRGQIEVEYEMGGKMVGPRLRRHRRRSRMTVRELLKRADAFERSAVRLRKKAEKTKVAEAKKKKR